MYQRYLRSIFPQLRKSYLILVQFLIFTRFTLQIMAAML